MNVNDVPAAHCAFYTHMMSMQPPESGRAVYRELEDINTAVGRKLDILEHFRDVFAGSGAPPSVVDRIAVVPSLCRVGW